MTPTPARTAADELEWACKFYCDWYEGRQRENPNNVAYELVSAIRKALAALRAAPSPKSQIAVSDVELMRERMDNQRAGEAHQDAGEPGADRGGNATVNPMIAKSSGRLSENWPVTEPWRLVGMGNDQAREVSKFIDSLRAAPSPGAGETLAYPRVIIDRGDVRLVQTSPPNSYLEVRRVSDNSEVVSTPCVVTEPKDEIIQLLHLAWLRSVQAQPPAVSASPASPASRKAR